MVNELLLIKSMNMFEKRILVLHKTYFTLHKVLKVIEAECHGYHERTLKAVFITVAHQLRQGLQSKGAGGNSGNARNKTISPHF